MLEKVRKDLIPPVAVSVAVLSLAAFFTAKSDLESYWFSSIVSSISVVAFAVPSFLAARRWVGSRHAIYLFAGFGILALTIEAFALVTGYPYGRFAYSEVVSQKLFGIVPWSVAFAWTPLVLAAYAFASKLTKLPYVRVITAAMLLVAFDLVLDPGAVSLGLWSYEVNDGFYNVPFSNFAGWFFTGLIASSILEFYVRRTRPLLPVPVQLGSSAFLILYFWTCVSIFEGLTWPFLAGVVLLVFLGYLSWRYWYAFDEMVVLIDDDNRAIATASKLEIHTSHTPLHRAFSVFLFNSAGELLLQQRASSKRTWPGVWSNSCCGHVMLHENIEDAARRRLRYELGIRNVRLFNLVPQFSYRAEKDGVVENEVCPILIGFTDDEPRPNPSEVGDVMWTSWQKFVTACESEPEGYSPWAVLEADELRRSPTFSFYVNAFTSGETGADPASLKKPAYE